MSTTNDSTYGDFNGRRRVLAARDFGVFAIVQAPLDVLFEFAVALQVLAQEADEVLRENITKTDRLKRASASNGRYGRRTLYSTLLG